MKSIPIVAIRYKQFDSLWPFTETETAFLAVIVVAFGCFVLGFWAGADAIKAVCRV